MRAYLASLREELQLWGKRLGRVRVESVFFGGGTPSLLPGEALGGLLADIHETFALGAQVEISAEANPESALTEGWLYKASRAGVNRLSLGVQSFDDADLALLGRAHNAHAVEAVFARARAVGFSNISLDLIWALPGQGERHQSQAQWLRQLGKAIEMQPEHISSYGFFLEPGSPLARARSMGENSLPPEKTQVSMYLAGVEFLESRGYRQYEISNFSRPGFACRHNLGYWTGDEYLGLGPGATSTLGDRRWTNAKSLSTWQKAVQQRTVAMRYEKLDRRTRLKELLMLRLRMSRGLSLREWSAVSGRSFLNDFALLVERLQQNGLAVLEEGHFFLTRQGMLVSDSVLSHFFACLEAIAGEYVATADSFPR